MGWSLVTSSTRRADSGLEGEAARLIGQFDVVSRFVYDQRGFLPEWRNQKGDASHWQDVAVVAELIEQGLVHDESVPPKPWPEIGMSGSVQAYHPGTNEGVADCLWRIGGDGTFGFHTSYTFEAGQVPFPAEGPQEPLARFLVTAAAAVEAEEARITVRGLQRALRRMRRDASGRIGALTLVLEGARLEQLPEGVTAIPVAEDYPGGFVLAVDLGALDAPNELAQSLVALDELLMQQRPENL